MKPIYLALGLILLLPKTFAQTIYVETEDEVTKEEAGLMPGAKFKSTHSSRPKPISAMERDELVKASGVDQNYYESLDQVDREIFFFHLTSDDFKEASSANSKITKDVWEKAKKIKGNRKFVQ